MVISIMEDFSRFGGVSEDWNIFIAANPRPQIPPDVTPAQLQHMTNVGRESVSREILSTVTSNSSPRRLSGLHRSLHTTSRDQDTRFHLCLDG